MRLVKMQSHVKYPLLVIVHCHHLSDSLWRTLNQAHPATLNQAHPATLNQADPATLNQLPPE